MTTLTSAICLSLVEVVVLLRGPIDYLRQIIHAMVNNICRHEDHVTWPPLIKVPNTEANS